MMLSLEKGHKMHKTSAITGLKTMLEPLFLMFSLLFTNVNAVLKISTKISFGGAFVTQ